MPCAQGSQHRDLGRALVAADLDRGQQHQHPGGQGEIEPVAGKRADRLAGDVDLDAGTVTVDATRLRLGGDIIEDGLSGMLVTFSDHMDGAANRAAFAFRAAVDGQGWPEVRETSLSLVSVYLVIDLVSEDIDHITDKLRALLDQQDWYAAPLPDGRTLWHVPTVYPGYAKASSKTARIPGFDVLPLSGKVVRFGKGPTCGRSPPPSWPGRPTRGRA